MNRILDAPSLTAGAPDPLAAFRGGAERAEAFCACLEKGGAAPGLFLLGEAGPALESRLEARFGPVHRAPWPAPSGDATAPGEAFATVCSYGLLHRLEEPGLALWEAWQRLSPGGILLLRDLRRPENEREVEELLHRYADGDPPEILAAAETRLRAALTPEELRMEAFVLRLFDVEVLVDDDLHMSLRCTKAATP